MTNADKIRAAELMYGTGSRQHEAAIKKYSRQNSRPDMQMNISAHTSEGPPMDIDELIRHYTAKDAIRKMARENGWKQAPYVWTPGQWDEQWWRGELLVLVNYTPTGRNTDNSAGQDPFYELSVDTEILDAVVVHLRAPRRLGAAYRIQHSGYDRIVLHELHAVFTREQGAANLRESDETEVTQWIEEVADGDWLAVPTGNRSIAATATGIRRRLAALRIRGERAAAPLVIEPEPQITLSSVVAAAGAALLTGYAGTYPLRWVAGLQVPVVLDVVVGLAVVAASILVWVLTVYALAHGVPKKVWNKALDAVAPIEISPWATVPSVITGRRYTTINDRPMLTEVQTRPVPPSGRVGEHCAIYLVAEQICQAIRRGHESVHTDHGHPAAAAFGALDPGELIDVDTELREIARAVAALIAHTELVELHAQNTVAGVDGRQAVNAERAALIRRVTALYTYDRRLDETVQRQRNGRKTPDFQRELLALVGPQQPAADLGTGFGEHISDIFGQAWLHDDATDRIRSTARRFIDDRRDGANPAASS